MKIRNRTMFATLTAAISVLVSILPVTVSGATSGSRPSLAALVSEIANSVKINNVPNLAKTLPPLASMTDKDGVISDMHYACYSALSSSPVPADSEISCAWGNVSSSRSILLFGDDQAAMWLPAMNQFGIDHKWKIIFLAKPGCPPWINPNKTTYTGGSRVGCNTFVKDVIAFANANHPSFLMPVGRAGDYGKSQFPTAAKMESEIINTISALAPSKGHVIFLDQVPWYESWFTKQTPSKCLTGHPTNVTTCLLKATADTNVVRLGLSVVARLEKLPLVPVRKLFCSKTKCALFVKASDGNHLVYLNKSDINRFYSVWISAALGELLKPYLPA